jgi:hypothetical protein
VPEPWPHVHRTQDEGRSCSIGQGRPRRSAALVGTVDTGDAQQVRERGCSASDGKDAADNGGRTGKAARKTVKTLHRLSTRT